MISLLIWLLILCLVFGIIYYVIGLLPVPQPFKNIILIILGLILVLILVSQLGLLGPVNLGRPLLR